FPTTADDTYRVRAKNAASLLSLEAADAGISPTQWQRAAFPAEYRERISIAHEGVDTDLVRPDPAAEVVVGKKIRLTACHDVVAYVGRILEPYRGFHGFMRALPESLRRRPKVHVLIAGADGVSYGNALPKGQTYLKKYLAEVGGKLDMERVHFLGQVPYGTL